MATTINLPTELLLEVCRYVGLKEAVQSMSLVSRDFLTTCCRAFLSPGDARKSVRGALPEPSGRLLSEITNVLRGGVFAMGCGVVSDEAEAILNKDPYNIPGLRARDLLTDMQRLNTGVYTYWLRTPRGPEGAFEHLQGTAACNPHLGWEPDIRRDVCHWRSDRITGEFIVLLDRPDGAVLCTPNLQTFYLVVGIAQSIVSILQAVYPPYAAYDKTIHSGKALGMRVHTTLLPWDGSIVYDGLLSPVEQVSDRKRRAAVAAYIRAVDSGKLIKAIQKTPVVLPGEAVVEALSSDAMVSLARLAKAKGGGNKKEMWVLRRSGYTEETNPAHTVCIMNGPMPVLPEAFVPLRQLVPTVNEYICLIERAVSSVTHCKPPFVLVDEDTIVSALESALKETGIEVGYYPPPSEEEDRINEITNPLLRHDRQYVTAPRGMLCYVCSAPRASAGGPLLQCARCKDVYYCRWGWGEPYAYHHEREMTCMLHVLLLLLLCCYCYCYDTANFLLLLPLQHFFTFYFLMC
jgi:hypothetical protein